MSFADIITLTTDFGLQDPYVGQVKGAILTNNISVRIIDLCHFIPAHDILSAAVAIRSSYSYFPNGSIHLVIVDPGVGSQRHILAAASKHHLFIAPDNGTLSLLFKDNKIKTIHRIENASLFPSEISATFHARDIMGPVAAALAEGTPLDLVGPITDISSCIHLNLPEPSIYDTKIEGQALHIDHFGNIRTNITFADLSKFPPSSFSGLRMKKHQLSSISSTYTAAPSGSLVAVVDSSGYLEIAVNKGSAAQLTKCRIGDPLVVLMEGSKGLPKK